MKLITKIKDKLDTSRWAKTADSYKAFMSNHDRLDSCYNPETHDCDGGCQGASNCLMAQYFRGEIKEPKPSKVRRSKIDGVKLTEKLDYIWNNIDWSELNEKVRDI